MTQKTWFRTAVLLLGLAVLLAVFMRVEAARREATGAASTCAINQTWDCDRVQRSEWGKAFGVSLSIWGAAANLIVLLWLIAARDRRGLLPLAGLAALANAAAGLFMAWVSWSRIGAFCLYCTILQVLMLGIAALVVPAAWRAWRERETNRPAAPDRAGWGFAGLIAAMVLAVFAAGDAYASANADFADLARPYEGSATRIDLAGRLVLGDPDTPHMVVLYFCFGCPNCRACYHRARVALEDPQVRQKVHFVFKHFPLDTDCNKALSTGPNRRSCRASTAGQTAASLGKQEDALRYLFGLKDRHKEFTNYNLDRMNEALGLGFASKAEWRAARKDARVAEIIRRDVAEGNAMGLVGVPAVYINGSYVRSKDLLAKVKRLARTR